MIDLDIVLLESQAFRVAAVKALGDHKQLWDAEINDLTVRDAHADKLPFEVEFLQGLNANAQAAIGLADESIALGWNDAVMRVEADAGLEVLLQVELLHQLKVAAQQFLDGSGLGLEGGWAIKHLYYTTADFCRIRPIWRSGRV